MIRFRDSEWEGLDGMGEETLREMRPQAERAVKRAGLHFERELKRTLSGRRSGRTYVISRTGKVHVASAPGEPPAVLFGALRGSIGHRGPEWRAWTVQIEVGVGLGTKASGDVNPDQYAARMEFGGADSRGGYIEPRPYMAPTAARVEPTIERMFEGAL